MLNLYKEITHIFVVILVFISCNIALASSNINIKSKQLSINKDESSATFSGNVVLSFQDFKLYCASLKIYYSSDSKLEKIQKIIIPSKLKVIKNCKNEIAIADHGHFNNNNKLLTLEGNVNMMKDDNILVTNKLVYLAEIETKKKKHAT